MKTDKMKTYEPHPIDITDVTLSEELINLTELIAKNAHETWAQTRINQGWTVGPERDDANKEHPNLIPYESLSEKEKDYDRIIAMNTIKLVKKLGFDIVKLK